MIHVRHLQVHHLHVVKGLHDGSFHEIRKHQKHCKREHIHWNSLRFIAQVARITYRQHLNRYKIPNVRCRQEFSTRRPIDRRTADQQRQRPWHLSIWSTRTETRRHRGRSGRWTHWNGRTRQTCTSDAENVTNWVNRPSVQYSFSQLREKRWPTKRSSMSIKKQSKLSLSCAWRVGQPMNKHVVNSALFKMDSRALTVASSKMNWDSSFAPVRLPPYSAFYVK